MSEGLTSNIKDKKYLGDGLYAEYDGFGVWLCVPDGSGTGLKRMVYLEPEVYEALKRFMEE